MNRERLRHATRIFQQLEQGGVADALHPHSGDRLIAWGELPKDLKDCIRALDLRSFLVLEPAFANAGLCTPWASSELTIGITDLARFFDLSEAQAFFIFGPQQTPVFAHAVERIRAILERAYAREQDRLSVRQHTQLEAVYPWAA